MIETDVQVIGFGVASLGIAIAADRMHGLLHMLNEGLIYVERKPDLAAWNSLAYCIESNSDADDFLAAIRPDGLFASSLASAPGETLRRHGRQPVQLAHVARFFQVVAADFITHAWAYQRSGVIFGKEVAELALQSDGGVVSMDHSGKALVRSKRAILAVGAQEDPVHRAVHSMTGDMLPSESVLRGTSESKLRESIDAGRQIVIMGGSHSAFSVAHHLLSLHGDRIHANQIIICARHPARYFYDNPQQARNDGCDFSSQLIDSMTGQVNRTSGLRGAAALLARRIASGRERKVQLAFEYPSGIASALQIHAQGYIPRPMRLSDPQGNPILLKQAERNILVSEQGNAIDVNGTVLPSVFALGHGHATMSITGPLVGVNFFHNAAQTIVRTIMENAVAPISPLLSTTAMGDAPHLAHIPLARSSSYLLDYDHETL